MFHASASRSPNNRSLIEIFLREITLLGNCWASRSNYFLVAANRDASGRPPRTSHANGRGRWDRGHHLVGIDFDNGWLTGAGMTAIYTDDQKQFSNNFWATIDYGRLPGTTVDGADFGAPVQWSFYGNASGGLRWTGGSTVLGAYTSAGMEFDMSGFLSQEQPQTRLHRWAALRSRAPAVALAAVADRQSLMPLRDTAPQPLQVSRLAANPEPPGQPARMPATHLAPALNLGNPESICATG